jgi:toxin-antitoxin system PIN domain toxin
MKSFFPDVNVWVALAYRGHRHHSSAVLWFESLDDDIAYFCRVTQLSFLRLISHPSVMGGDVKTPIEAWRAYDVFLGDERVSFRPEPDGPNLESSFRRLTSAPHPSSKPWPDAYLSAFAQAADMILITFDRGLHQMNSGKSLLLK